MKIQCFKQTCTGQTETHYDTLSELMTKLKILNGQILQYYNYQAQAQVQVLGPELYNKFGFHQVSWTSDGLV